VTWARPRALLGALAIVGASGIWTLVGARPAAAYVCNFGISGPAAGSVSGSPDVRFTGPFEIKPTSGDRILDVTFTQSPGPAPAPMTRSGAAVGATGRFDLPSGPLALNGRYTARVTARHAETSLFNCDGGLDGSRRDSERTAEVTFGVSVRAAPPTNVGARFDAGSRTATVTWEKSGDPDIAGYTIAKKVGSDAPTFAQVRPDPLSWTDTGTSAGAATIIYAVQASRNGPDPGTTSEPSVLVAAAPLDVPAPPPTPTTTTPAPGGAGGTGGAGGGTSTRTTPTTTPFALGRSVGATGPAPSGTVPALRFPSGLAGPKSTNSTAPASDGGYQPLLPYPSGGSEPPATMPIDTGGDQALGPGQNREGGGGGTPQLAYVASGLLSIVVAGHVLWLRKQVSHPEMAGATGSLPPLEPLHAVGPTEPPTPTGPGAVQDTSPFEPAASLDPAVPPGSAVIGLAAPGPRPHRDAGVPAGPAGLLPAPVVPRGPAVSAGSVGQGGPPPPLERNPEGGPVPGVRGAILRPARSGSLAFEPVGSRPVPLRASRAVRQVVEPPPAVGNVEAVGLVTAAESLPPGRPSTPTRGRRRPLKAVRRVEPVEPRSPAAATDRYLPGKTADGGNAAGDKPIILLRRPIASGSP